MIAMYVLCVVTSCSKDKHDKEPLNYLTTEILSGDKATADVFCRWYDLDYYSEIWLDYIEYHSSDFHLEILGHEKEGLPLEPKLFAEVKIDGEVWKTRRLGDWAFKLILSE